MLNFPTLIQANKKQETYVTGFQAVARKCTLENEELSIITHGEQALTDSCKISFRKCNLYMCTKHFKSNCEEVLNKIGIPSSQQCLMLDVVFRGNRIIESENKKGLSENLEIAWSVLDAYEKSIQGNDSKKFSAYLKEREKAVLRKPIRSTQRKALKTIAKIPPRLYTNHSESVNSILAAKEAGLGYNKNEDVTQSFFMQKIWKATLDHQSLEIEKTICNQSNEFPLAGHAEYLSFSLEDCIKMSRQNQETYIQQFTMMSNGDIK